MIYFKYFYSKNRDDCWRKIFLKVENRGNHQNFQIINILNYINIKYLNQTKIKNTQIIIYI